jgi:hypothetical protein
VLREHAFYSRNLTPYHNKNTRKQSFVVSCFQTIVVVASPEMIGPHEALVADWAGEVLLAGVRPRVARQLVRPRESLAAPRPATRERTLA